MSIPKERIEELIADGHTLDQIAMKEFVSPATVSRLVKRYEINRQEVIYNKIMYLRKEKKMLVKEVAEVFGVTPRQIYGRVSRYEQGKKNRS